MKIAIINKSDSTGGAAVVSFRLMNALRAAGVDARMFVAEKLTDSEYVALAAKPIFIKSAFLYERLKIFIANGFNRDTLFKIDTAVGGLPIHTIPFVKEADVICLNWVNQGMLSLQGLEQLMMLGKPIIWTMHDMWNFTGICHHAGSCHNYRYSCSFCPLLGKKASLNDLANRTWIRKQQAYNPRKSNYLHAQNLESPGKLHFVAVSNWLADKAKESSLLGPTAPISVIPNAFPIAADLQPNQKSSEGKLRIVMGAARLDDPVKGFPILVEATKQLREKYPQVAADTELITFGNFRYPESYADIAIDHKHLGTISGEEKLRKIYGDADVVISTSLYETLPTTLVEGQMYGAIPVSFTRGGQSDIINHKSTGYLADFDDDINVAAANIVEGILWAYEQKRDEESMRKIRERMLQSARDKFSSERVAEAYINLANSLLN